MLSALLSRLVAPTGLIIALNILLLLASNLGANKVRIRDIAMFQNEQRQDCTPEQRPDGFRASPGDAAGPVA